LGLEDFCVSVVGVGWFEMVELHSGVDVSEGLSAFVADVVVSMGRVERRCNAEVYVAGMLAQGDRKSLQPMVERQGGTLAAYESLQQFVADSPWDPVGVSQGGGRAGVPTD